MNNSTALNHSEISTKIVDDHKSGQTTQSKALISPSVGSSMHLQSTTTSALRTQRSEAMGSEAEQKPIESASYCQLCFDFSVSTGRILDCFAAVGTQLGFNLIEEQSSYATMVKQKKRRLLDIINCLNFGGDEEGVTAVKIIVKTNQAKSVRVARLRGLVGSKDEVKRFLDEFRIKSKALKELTDSHFEQQSAAVQQMQSNPFQIEVCADYAFYKILSLEKYGLGKKLAQQIQDFKQAFKNPQQSVSLLPLPIKNLYNIVGEIVDSLFKQFNAGRKQMEKVMPYCRVSVEKYVCEKLYDTIYPIYWHKTKTQQQEFIAKRATILKQWGIKDIYAEAGLHRKHWLVKDEPQSYNNPLTLTNFKQKRACIPFSKGIEQFQKLQSTENIRQKLKCCQFMYTKIKSMIFDFTGGKQELNNIQDILPITIIVVLLADIKHLRAELDVMIDFLSFQSTEHESQKRLLTNLSESYNYIRRDWKVQ